MWGFSCKGWLQKLFVFPILRSLAQGVLFGSFVLFRSHCSPVTFRRRDSPIMHSSVPDEFKPVIFEAGRTIDHLGPIFSDVARCCQFALYARTHAIYIYIYIIPCDAAIDSPGKIVLKLKLTNFFEIHRVWLIQDPSVQQKAFDFWDKRFVMLNLQTSIHYAAPPSMLAIR